MKKCEGDATKDSGCEAKAVSKDGKPLAGAWTMRTESASHYQHAGRRIYRRRYMQARIAGNPREGA